MTSPLDPKLPARWNWKCVLPEKGYCCCPPRNSAEGAVRVACRRRLIKQKPRTKRTIRAMPPKIAPTTAPMSLSEALAAAPLAVVGVLFVPALDPVIDPEIDEVCAGSGP